MKKFIFFTALLLILSCENSHNPHTNFKTALDKYIKSYPIEVSKYRYVKNYNYVSRIYRKNKDTILEIGQDIPSETLPVDFRIIIVDKIEQSINFQNKEAIYVGYFIRHKRDTIYLFDTKELLGKKLYKSLSINKEDIRPKELLNQLNYPFIPIRDIYKISGNEIELMEKTDTIKFK